MEAQDTGQNTWHALCFPLSSKIHTFVHQFPEQAQLRNAPIEEQLATLSTLLKNQKYTISISRLFSPILVDLCVRWLDDQEQDEAKFAVFGLLLPIHEELYRVFYLFMKRESLAKGPLAFVTRENASQIPVKTLHILLLAYLRLLEACDRLYEKFYWPVVHLQSLCEPPHPDAGVRLLAVRCFAHHVGMNEPARVMWEERVVGTLDDVDPLIDTGFGDTVDGWVLPILEHKRIVDERENYFKLLLECKGPVTINTDFLSSRTICIGGVLFPKASLMPCPSTRFIPTDALAPALHQIARLITRRRPILITGPPSSGKTLIIEHIMSALFSSTSQIVRIHLGDVSLDPSSLIGSYVSSSKNPGTFDWKEGVLVTAMREAKVLILEDLDKASGEVLGTLWPLVESLSMIKAIGADASLRVSGRGSIRAMEGFTLFATVTTSYSSLENSPLTFLSAHKWDRVVAPSPSKADVQTIIHASFPRLNINTVKATLRVWDRLCDFARRESSWSRPFVTRDLMKWCARIDALVGGTATSVEDSMDIDEVSFSDIFRNPVLREEMFLEARDVFLGAFPTSNITSTGQLKKTAVLLSSHFSISEDRLQWLLEKHTPQIQFIKSREGRISNVILDSINLPTFQEPNRSSTNIPNNRPFALHRQSLLLLTSIARSVQLGEPVLLTGETGTGKTTLITYLASILSQKLVSLNLSHQTDSSDLLGGFKPVEASGPAQQLQERFAALFSATFSREKNLKFEEAVRVALTGKKWKRAVLLWREATEKARDRIRQKNKIDQAESVNYAAESAPRKRRKLGDSSELLVTDEMWQDFRHTVDQFEVQHVIGKTKFVFEFVEGPLVTALRKGHWVLLDEVNLASAETLEAISSILQGPTSSITLTEQGDIAPVPRHPNFRLFCCMNPATDVGKKDLPHHIRSYLTEFYVSPPESNRDALLAIVNQYIVQAALSDKAAVMDVAEFYTSVKSLAMAGDLADGSNQRPHYSIRTLTRALTFALDAVSAFGLRRSLWEGCTMAFSAPLDAKSAEILKSLAYKHLLNGLRNVDSILSQKPPVPTSDGSFISVGPFWLECGPIEPASVDHYIVTTSVRVKLLDLARMILTRRFPILIEGPTSSGKTSTIEYLAKRTGHRFIRINNHEHTDIQEYMGSYVTDPETGLLTFRDGLLVQALRRGDWIVLDELNLAPSDVLEALNRLLDDNRELFIPETGELLKPHPHFMIFATQNPAGLYGGRKVLSRAFRNRFLEVHFQDVPPDELEQILKERCLIAPSYAQRIVSVFFELQHRRQTSRVFETKQSFATLRDLFRWAGRDASSVQELADNGYMLIAERSRKEEDKQVVKEVIESVMKVRIDEHGLYNVSDSRILKTLDCPLPSDSSFVWTPSMQRLFVLLARALRHNEPVLLVGETGSGKTSICQLYAKAIGRQLRMLNCHQNTETADILGGQRPLRNRQALVNDLIKQARLLLPSSFPGENSNGSLPELLEYITASLKSITEPEEKTKLRKAAKLLSKPVPLFEWEDGPLVLALRSPDILLLDEISLADDSVLERLNSVLEPSRTLVLAEKGGADNLEVTAVEGFQIISTMNPGGDYGKKELSPALRNRFTEIWVPPITSKADKLVIVRDSWKYTKLIPFTEPIIDIVQWMAEQINDPLAFGLRDILAWVHFSEAMAKIPETSEENIFYHAAHMVILDGLASLPQTQGWSQASLSELHNHAVDKLIQLAPNCLDTFEARLTSTPTSMGIGPFQLQFGPLPPAKVDFAVNAPTTLRNALRVFRACQLDKPILLEGSPGVGKTSLIAALSAMLGYKFCRVNLSDQTDLMDLFGSDLPVEGGLPGEFAWRDAAFLQALQQGEWVLLDEMNLAPQSILEGLNAVLDHRGSVYVPELGRSFHRHPDFRVFAAQNPFQQGGGRKGLPKSFLNRFTKVYMEELTSEDYLMITSALFSDWPQSSLRDMIKLNQHLHEETSLRHLWGRDGSPWEFNLRDIMRWLTLYESPSHLELQPRDPVEFLDDIYLQRFRSSNDRTSLSRISAQIFNSRRSYNENPHLSLSSSFAQFGHALLRKAPAWRQPSYQISILQTHIGAAQSIQKCIENGWLVILTGGSATGKTSILRHFASFHGTDIVEFHANSATDTSDLLGGFEQVSHARSENILLSLLKKAVDGLAGSTPFTTPDIHELLQWQGHDLQKVDSLLKLLPEGFQKDQLLEAIHHYRSSDARAKFEWVDGPLVQALRSGSWFVLDNANLCNPSVLDRLNSLCELGGTLSLTERGLIDNQIEVLRPHPNFRLFMCMDPAYGELSRAMRNRGVEIYLQRVTRSEDLLSLQILDRQSCNDIHASPYYLAHLPHKHLLSPLQMLLKLSAYILALPEALRLQFVTNYLPLRYYRLLYRLSPFETLREALKAFASAPLMINFVNLIKGSCGLPSGFLETQGVHPMLNPNFYGSLCSANISSHIEQFLHNMDLTFRMKQVDERLEAAQKSESRMATWVFGGDMAGHHTAGTSPAELRTIQPVFTALRRIVNSIIRQISPVTGMSNYITLMELLEQACDIFLHDYMDYSLWRYILQQIRSLVPSFLDTSLEEVVSDALNTIKLRSGHAMENIWGYHKSTHDGRLRSRSLSLQLNGIVIGGPQIDTVAYELRKQILDLAALLTLEEQHKSQPIPIITPVGTIRRKEAATHYRFEARKSPHRDFGEMVHLTLVQLSAVGLVILNPERFPTFLARFCETALRSNAVPTPSLVSSRAVVLERESNIREPTPEIFNVFQEWSISVRLFESPDINPIIHPVTLLSTLNLCAQRNCPIDLLEAYAANITVCIQSAALESEYRRMDRREDLSLCLSNDIIAASRAIDPGANAPDGRLSRPNIAITDDFFSKAISLDADDHYLLSLREALGAFVRPRMTGGPFEELEILAVQWVALGLAMLHLYIPSFPLDPYSPSESVRRYLSLTCGDIKKEIHVHSCAEDILTGNRSNLVTKRLEARLEEFQKRLDHSPKLMESRREIGDIHAMMAEFVQFHDQVLDINRITALLQAIKNKEANAASREAVLQDSCLKFTERIEARYPELGDLNHPVVAWVERLRLGFRLLRDLLHLTDMQDRENANSFIGAICSFPTTVGMLTISSRLLVPPASIQPKDWSLICAHSVISQLKDGHPIEVYQLTIWNAFEQMFGAWLGERSRKEQEEQSNASIYKQRKDFEKQRTDEELEQEEFRRLFPEFDDILADDQELPPKQQGHFVELPSPYLMFQNLFSFQSQRSSLSTPLPHLPLAHWANRIAGKLNFTLDASSVFFRLQHMHNAEEELSRAPLSQSQYNFYVHRNFPELAKALKVVHDMQARLLELANRWPEQMVLKHLSERCQAILNLDLHSSLARVLSALEQLLLHSEDWQRFADKENSIQDQQQAIGNLIIEWRRLELSCWAHLLDNQALTFANDIGNWWFLLYESIVRTSMTQSTDTSENSTFLKQFLPFLETFLTKSPIGQFSSRLNLLKDFAAYLSMLSSVHPSCSESLNRVSALLVSVIDFYGRFTSKVTATLGQRRKDLDKEVQSFIKLASWKDVNVLALKASAQRTHHQLYKLIRKFRATLEEPITPLLTEAPAIESELTKDLPQRPSADFVNKLPDLPSSTYSHNHLLHLDNTLSIFSQILQNEATEAVQLPAESVEGFSINILSQIIELQNAVPPAGVKNSEKWYKNLHSRKRKAFSDLIKACKEHGLSVNPKPAILTSQNERLWLLERRTVLPSSYTNSRKMDAYFDSVIVSITKLHAMLSSHSDDISTRDLTKLTSLAHSTLALALEAREYIRTTAQNSSQISLLVDSIKGIHADNPIALINQDAKDFVLRHLSVLCHTIASAKEMIELATAYPEISKEAKPFDHIRLSEFQSQIQTIIDAEERVKALYLRMKDAKLPLLLLDEKREIKTSITAVKNLLHWSKDWSRRDTKAYHLCNAFISSLEQSLEDLSDPTLFPEVTRAEFSERPINLMLSILQRLKGFDMSRKVGLIQEGVSHFRQLRMVFDASMLWKELQDFLEAIHTSPESTIMAQRLYPFVHQFNILAASYIENLLAWTKSLLKLAAILFNLACTLAEKGFCKPSDGKSNDGQEGKGLDSEGVGIGEGMGEKDISDEIQDKSQVEGLRGEEASSNTDTKEQDNAVEMSDDEIEGDLEDVKQSDDDDESQADQESEPEDEPEERNEALDPADPNAVDEKLWGGADRTEDKDEDKTTDKPADKDEPASDEIAGKKEDENKPQNDGQNDENRQSKDTSEPQDEAYVTSDEEVEMPDTDNLPAEAGAELDNQVQEQEVLNLPDDLKLDEADNKLGDDDEDEGMEEDFGKDEDNDGLNDDIEDRASEMVSDTETGPPEGKADGEEDQNPEASENNPMTQVDKTEGQSQQDSGIGSSGAGKSEEAQEDLDNAMDVDVEEATHEQNLCSTQDANHGSTATFSGAGDAGGEHTTKAPVNSTDEKDPTNISQTSQRTLAEQFDEVRRRYEQILEQMDQEQSQQNPANINEPHLMEHVDKDADDTFAALGPAGQEKAAKLRELNVTEDHPKIFPSDDNDVHDHLEEIPTQSSLERLSLSEREPQHGNGAEEPVISSSNLPGTKLVEEEGSEAASLSLPKGAKEQITSEDVESRLVSWRENQNPREGAEPLWRLYSSLTHDLAWSLCEQLRLILEPTKATRLRGDYRTGKRLNMKKVIPYIASEYTKDKIWLRRTRPSQREYRIIIALDDSRSMSESHSEHLSFETLALVSRALTRLEAGDISILKFGETIDVLHGFNDGPFNDATGAKMISSFNFDQNSTNVLSLVETSLQIFQDAKEKHGSSSSSAADLWQLEIIISDGICSHHDQLRAILRKALDARVLVVFLIVDSLSRQGSRGRMDNSSGSSSGDAGVHNSILSMQTVREDLTVERYLDTFPFEYYVVLRSVDALPEVLAGTLRQFFERVAGE